MKKTFRLFIAAFAAVTALASCAKTIDEDMSVKSQEADGMRVITIVYDSDTKTGPSYNDWHKPVFVNGDQIKVMNDSGIETCTVNVYDGNVTFVTSLTGELTAVYPAERGYKRGSSNIIDTYPPHLQDGTLASGHIASATIPGGSSTAVFHNETALLRIYTPAGTKQLTITSVSTNDISNGIFNGGWSEAAIQSVIVGDGAKELGTCYVSIHPGVNLSSLTFDAGIATKTVKYSVVTKAGVAYTISSEGWYSPLPGKFSVSATKQVQFSKGNLQATYTGSGYSWGFAANQYDYPGNTNASGNTTIDNQKYGRVVDLFGWSTSATNFGISSSTSDNDYLGDFVDWGKTFGEGSVWRTLSKDEWRYLYDTRANAKELRGWATICGKPDCEIIAPDGYKGTIVDTYTASTWPAAEAAGLVCLPPTGYREGSSVDGVGDGAYAFYWSSTPHPSHPLYAYAQNGASHPRRSGYSVRLVKDVK